MTEPSFNGQLTRPRFAQVPIQLLEDCAERKGTIFVFAWLWHYAGQNDAAFPSVQRLALECHMKPDDIRAALKYLAEAGWITRVDRPGQTTIFHVRTENPQPKRRRNPSPKRGTPKRGTPPNGVSPKRGSTPLPQTGEGTPPPKGGPNKKYLTRTTEQEKDIDTHPLPATPPMAPAAPTSVPLPDAGQIGSEPSTVACSDADPKPQRSTTTRQANAKPLALPAFAEPYRSQLAAWWRLRKRKHPKADQAGLSSRSINALTLAHERGILAAFCDLAAEKGWESLGFSGYRKAIDQLAADEAYTPGITPLHQARRNRQEEAFDNVISFLKTADPEFA